MKHRKIYNIIGIIFVVLLWFILSYFELVNRLFLPLPHKVFNTFFELIFSGSILPDFLATLLRMVSGFLLALIIGVPLGVLIGYFDKVYDSLEFLIDFFRSIPATALIPLFLLLFGIGEESKILLVAFVCSLIIIVNTMYGVHNGNKLRIHVAKSMGASKLNILSKVILPESMPHTFAGLRIALSFSLIIVIVNEIVIGTNAGLGNRIIESQLVFNTKELYAVIIFTGILGYLINMVFLVFEKTFVHWSGK